MKISYCTLIGAPATVAYVATILIKGGMDMDSAHQVEINGHQLLEAANKHWDEANSAYQTSLNKLTDAENTITDAKCFINSYQDFYNKRDIYCAPAVNPVSNLITLSSAYGIQIKYFADETEYSTGSESYQKAYEYCYDKNEDETVCETRYKPIYYNIDLITHIIYGAQLHGSGSGISMVCGRFSHGMKVIAYDWSTDSGWSIDGYYFSWTHGRTLISSKSRTIRYYSEVDADVNIENTGVTSNKYYELPPSASNFEAAANVIVPMIFSQCEYLRKSLRKPSHYEEVISSTTAKLPTLKEDLDSKSFILQRITAHRNATQNTYNTANAKYHEQLSIWLPQLFVAVPAIILILWCIEGSCEQTEYNPCMVDTDKPFECCFELFKHKAATSNVTATSSFRNATNDPDTSPSVVAREIEMNNLNDETPVAQTIEQPSFRTFNEAPDAKLALA